MEAWFNQYIGTPWEPAGGTLAGFDCWGWCKFVKRTFCNQNVPDYLLPYDKKNHTANTQNAIADALQGGLWVELESPAEKCIIVLGKASRASHVGVVTLVGGVWLVVHSVQGKGVICQPLSQVKREWKLLNYFDWHGNPC